MTFDTFDEGIAPGGLRSKHEIKILICYLFHCVKDRMSKELVVEAIRAYELANFFELSVAFDELVQSEKLIAAGTVDNEEAFALTETGGMIAEQLEDTLAFSVKEKALKCALELLSERKTARENTVTVQKNENGYLVTCKVSGGDMDLLSFTMYAPDSEQADIIKKGFLSYPSTVYKTMLALMTQNRDVVGEALEDVYGINAN